MEKSTRKTRESDPEIDTAVTQGIVFVYDAFPLLRDGALGYRVSLRYATLPVYGIQYEEPLREDFIDALRITAPYSPENSADIEVIVAALRRIAARKEGP